jgi:hypothetical protein
MLKLPPVSKAGIFDPSLAETAPDQRLWMSYSAVDPSPRWPKLTRAVSTRLAYSDDTGASWNDAGVIINPIVEAEHKAERRTWQNEVSSLVHDPFSPPEERWKLFWHHYPAIGEDRQFQHGWIAYKRAASPQGLSNASEVKLLGGTAYERANDVAGGKTGSPIAGSPIHLASVLGDELSDCVAFSEPDAISRSDGLYMVVGCYAIRLLPKPQVRSRIILLTCKSPCRPEARGAWRLVGTLLEDKQAKFLGATSYSASDLISSGDQTYLMVSPVGDTPFQGAYQGCVVFQFADLASAKLVRDGRNPKPVKFVRGAIGSFSGACTYASSAKKAGILLGEVSVSEDGLRFHIFTTGQTF